ncbi:hypothetical protein [Streptomyces sp. NPDC057552]|uniref:hypothetical protein n=1 Tax=Streptomyces sp. NPDC057552 TaxID=3350537 RepID=UPI0036B5D411
MLKSLTAPELADALDRVPRQSPDMTGPLSMIDEATLGWTRRYPQLTEVQQAFSRARLQQFPRTRTEQTWQEVVTTAGALLRHCASSGTSSWSGAPRRPAGVRAVSPHPSKGSAGVSTRTSLPRPARRRLSEAGGGAGLGR